MSVLYTPEMIPDLTIAQALPVIPAGLTFVITWAPPETCPENDMFCGFIKKHFGNPKVSIFLNANPFPPASLAVGGALSDVVLVWDKCGRPVFEMASVGITSTFTATGTSLGFQAFLTIDIGNLRRQDQSDFCSLRTYTDGQTYLYFEPLTFMVRLEVGTGGIGVTGAMIGTWTNAFGWDMLHISNLLLSITLTPALGFPAIEVKRNRRKEEKR